MSTTTDIRAARGVRPRQPAPDLTVPLLPGGTYRLSDQRPKLFTMVVFFRGLHCPVCRAQLTELDRRLDVVDQRGIDVIAVSGETLERTTQLVAALTATTRLPSGYASPTQGNDTPRRSSDARP
jgi:peroxiredoxin